MDKSDTCIECTKVTKVNEDAPASGTASDPNSEGQAEKDEPPKSTIREIFRINMELVPMKAHFFFFFGALAGVIPPLILYCQQLGASVSMVGILFSVLPFVQCISKPIAGTVADKWQRHKTIFLASMFLLTVSLFSVNFIPHDVDDDGQSEIFDFNGNITLIQCDGSVRFSACPSNYFKMNSINPERIICNLSNCDYPDSTQQQSVLFIFGITDNDDSAFGLVASLSDVEQANRSYCPEFHVKSVITSSNQSFEFNKTSDGSCFQVSLKCAAKCSAMTIKGEYATEGVLTGFGYKMVWLWVGCILAWSAYAIILSISDAILMNILGENRAAFGYTRLYSSIGWGLLSAVSAHIIDWVSYGKTKKNYSPGFYIFFGLMICDIVTALLMKVVVVEKPKALTRNLIDIFKRVEVVVFSVAVLLQGMVTGFLWTFVVVYANELNGSQLIIGLNYAVECFLSEIPFFVASGWIVKKLGYSNSLTFVLFVTGFKTLCYSFIYNAWYMLIIAIVHGITYGVLYSTLATYASSLANPSLQSSMQGIFQSILEGLGVGFGNLLGGFIYEKIGGRLTFRVFGCSLIIVAVVHWLIMHVFIRRPRTVSPEIAIGTINVTDHFVDVILESKTQPNKQNIQ